MNTSRFVATIGCIIAILGCVFIAIQPGMLAYALVSVGIIAAFIGLLPDVAELTRWIGRQIAEGQAANANQPSVQQPLEFDRSKPREPERAFVAAPSVGVFDDEQQRWPPTAKLENMADSPLGCLPVIAELMSVIGWLCIAAAALTLLIAFSASPGKDEAGSAFIIYATSAGASFVSGACFLFVGQLGYAVFVIERHLWLIRRQLARRPSDGPSDRNAI